MSQKSPISIIVPVYNEEKNIKPLYQELADVLRKIKLSYEIIFIDDGSTDQTITQLLNLRAVDKMIKVVQLQGNHGKASALQAGFDQSKGEYLITLDGDLQDDPREIPGFLQKLNEGYDLVCGWKYRRKDPLDKIVFSKIANFITRKATGVAVHDMNCGFKAYRRKVIRHLSLYGEMHRYIPVLVAKKGFRVGEIKVHHHPRKYGKSKYGMGRLLEGLFDFITVIFLTHFTTRPLHFFGLFGLIFGVMGFATGSYLTVIWLQGEAIGHRPLLILAVLLMVLGVQFFSIGLIGEMITNWKKGKDYIIGQVID